MDGQTINVNRWLEPQDQTCKTPVKINYEEEYDFPTPTEDIFQSYEELNLNIDESSDVTPILLHNSSIKLEPKNADYQDENKESTELSNSAHQVSVERRKYQKSQFFVRWGRKDDTKAFITINKYLRSQSLSLETFFGAYRPEYEQILTKIVKDQNWNRTSDCLYDRLCKVFIDAKKFSVRNIRKLKQLISRKQRFSNDELLVIQEHFPGATIEYIKAEIKNQQRFRHK